MEAASILLAVFVGSFVVLGTATIYTLGRIQDRLAALERIALTIRD